jgi:hypothetical protein
VIGRKGDKFVMIFDLACLMATPDIQGESPDADLLSSSQLQSPADLRESENVPMFAETVDNPATAETAEP